jgi:hypothetical protein
MLMSMYGKDRVNKKVLSRLRKAEMVSAEVMSAGNEFQTEAPTTSNARLPTVIRLKVGTQRRSEPEAMAAEEDRR